MRLYSQFLYKYKYNLFYQNLTPLNTLNFQLKILTYCNYNLLLEASLERFGAIKAYLYPKKISQPCNSAWLE